MFTGLIEGVARVMSLDRAAEDLQLTICALHLSGAVAPGDSVAVNGCCLTVARAAGEALSFDLLGETATRTNLAQLREGSLVNLERALAFGDRLGGHIVQGHIDVTSPITSLEERGCDTRLEIALPHASTVYVAEKGSVALDGISLTVAEVNPASFVTWIIPHTREHTNLRAARRGDLINIEWDILAKYVERMLPAAIKSAGGIVEKS